MTLATFSEIPVNFRVNELPMHGPPPSLPFISWTAGERYLSTLVVHLEKLGAAGFCSGITSYLTDRGVHWRSVNFPHVSFLRRRTHGTPCSKEVFAGL